MTIIKKYICITPEFIILKKKKYIITLTVTKNKLLKILLKRFPENKNRYKKLNIKLKKKPNTNE